MTEWIIALLTWMAATPDAVEQVRPRAATCAMIAYSTLHKQPVQEDEPEKDSVDQLSQPGGGTPPAQPTKKRMVKRCVDGKCYITYE